jgi:hypothetical protein
MKSGIFLKASICLVLIFSAVIVFSGQARAAEQAAPAPEPEPELVIVKYGSLIIKSSEPGAKVYVDDAYKGGSDSVIESLVAGEHVISCRTEAKSVSGTFHIRKSETLRLEARFDDGKLVLLKESAAKTEPEPRKPEPVKQEKPKKPVAEPKKVVEQKNPAEERRRTHLNVMRFDFEVNDSQDLKIEHMASQNVISKFTVKKNKSGKFYRTRQGVLLCDAGPCELAWTASFIYTDEDSKTDALLLKWKETVFNGITPSGTSKRELECCLNGQCWRMQDNNATDSTQESQIERYRLSLNKTSLAIRRSDIMKEILDAGRSLSDY